jgi:LmbE family N-acetylglucosaminyl deacetylase
VQRRWLTLTVGVLGGAALYWWQPQRLTSLRPRPASGPWTDPESERLFSADARVALVTAHPDDSEFYLGGLLQQLARAGAWLNLVVATDGDKGYQPFQDPARNVRTRRREQDTAARAWGAREVIYLGGRDGRLRAGPALVARLTRELERIRPEYVLLFDAESPPRVTHRDHLAIGAATGRAAREVEGIRWLLHFSTSAPNFAVDVTPDWERRWDLLHLHRSQFHGWRDYLARRIIIASASADGRLLRVPYGEGLRCERVGIGGPGLTPRRLVSSAAARW